MLVACHNTDSALDKHQAKWVEEITEDERGGNKGSRKRPSILQFTILP
jgi:hypothetical protein